MAFIDDRQEGAKIGMSSSLVSQLYDPNRRHRIDYMPWLRHHRVRYMGAEDKVLDEIMIPEARVMWWEPAAPKEPPKKR